MAGTFSGGTATRPNPAVLSRLEGLLESPLAQASLGLLAAGNAGPGESGNPYHGILGGLQRAQTARLQNAQFKTQQEQAAQQQALRDRLAAIYGTPSASGAPPVPGATPGINPAAPPMTPPVPGATPGINPAAPLMTPSVDIMSQMNHAMLQHGTPAQQLAAYNALTAQERFRHQADREDARFQQKREDVQRQLAENKIGQYNPRDYTSESFAEFARSRDPAALERYERIRVVDIGGVPYAIDTTTGQEIGPVGGGREAVIQNTRDVKQAGATGSAVGTATTAAQTSFSDMTGTEDELRQILSDPDFSQAVGPIDQYTGAIGESMGTRQGVLGGQAERLANQLVIEAVSNWKGAISEKELDFFLKSAPSRGSSPETWAHWFHKEYLPRKERVARVARGEVFNAPQINTPPSNDAPANALPNGLQWRLEE